MEPRLTNHLHLPHQINVFMCAAEHRNQDKSFTDPGSAACDDLPLGAHTVHVRRVKETRGSDFKSLMGRIDDVSHARQNSADG